MLNQIILYSKFFFQFSYCQYLNDFIHLPAVIIEFDDIVIVTVVLCIHDHLKQRFFLLLAINKQLPFEKPMTAMLTAEKERNKSNMS